jgi:hypothetical protein
MNNDDKIVVQEIIRVGSIPDNMIYWSRSLPTLWANVATTTNSWEIEVNFND